MFSEVKEPLTAEDYAKLDASEKYTLLLKWAYDGNAKEKLNFFDKPLERTLYSYVHKDSGLVVCSATSLNELAKESGIDYKTLNYLLRFADKDLKKYKYKLANIAKVVSSKQFLVGNSYSEAK